MDGEHRSLCYRGLFEKGVILFGVTTDGDRKRKIRQDNRYPLSIGYGCFFDIRRMETSIKVMLVAFIFVGFIIKSMDVVEMLNIQDLTLSMMCVIMVVSCVVFFLLYMAVIYVVNLGWDVIIMAVKSRTKKTESIVHPEGSAVSIVGNTSLNDVCDEEPAPKEEVAEVQEELVVEAPKATSSIINLPDPTKLENYIKENAATYSKGDGAAILFEILLDKEVIEDSLTDFHNWLKGLIDVIGYTGLSEARKRVIAKKNKGEDNIVEKYNELLDEITNYII